MKQVILLRIIVALIGLAIMLLGVNIGLGGIKTLGWQVSTDFLRIIDPAVFNIQDSHIRFIGGVWFGLGVLYVLGSFLLKPFLQTLFHVSLVIALAGLFRLSAMEAGTLLSADVLPSLILELVAFPLLAIWIRIASKKLAEF